MSNTSTSASVSNRKPNTERQQARLWGNPTQWANAFFQKWAKYPPSVFGLKMGLFALVVLFCTHSLELKSESVDVLN